MAHVLIIDDDSAIADILARQLELLGHESEAAQSLSDGIAQANSFPYDIVLLDINLPDGSGLSAMESFRTSPGAPEVIIITGQATPESAELAIKSGAWDYLAKPFSHHELELLVRQVLEYHREKAGLPQEPLRFDTIIGDSLAMQRCFKKLSRAAQSDAAVLITGETGTGKELLARALHEKSLRAGRRFVVVDCTVLPENLVESILFGHEKGAFTGAEKQHQGLIEKAHGGTLFLDEIGDMSLQVQRSFLRVLQERSFRPLGSDREVASDFRLIAATHRSLDRMVEEGLFRSDLMFRLKTFLIEIPPLRERAEDIQKIALYYINKLEARYQQGRKRASDEFFDALAAYPWPGNVRELVNAVESAFAESHNELTIYKKHLPVNIRLHQLNAAMKEHAQQNPSAAPEPPPAPDPASEQGLRTAPAEIKPFRSYKKEMEKQYLLKLLPFASKDIERACSLSGLSRSRLYELLRQHGLKL